MVLLSVHSSQVGNPMDHLTLEETIIKFQRVFQKEGVPFSIVVTSDSEWQIGGKAYDADLHQIGSGFLLIFFLQFNIL